MSINYFLPNNIKVIFSPPPKPIEFFHPWNVDSASNSHAQWIEDGVWLCYKPYWTNERFFMVSSREIPASCISNLEERGKKHDIYFKQPLKITP